MSIDVATFTNILVNAQHYGKYSKINDFRGGCSRNTIDSNGFQVFRSSLWRNRWIRAI